MLVAGRHAKRMQNYDCLYWARIMHGYSKRTRVGKWDEFMKYIVTMFSSFL